MVEGANEITVCLFQTSLRKEGEESSPGRSKSQVKTQELWVTVLLLWVNYLGAVLTNNHCQSLSTCAEPGPLPSALYSFSCMAAT